MPPLQAPFTQVCPCGQQVGFWAVPQTWLSGQQVGEGCTPVQVCPAGQHSVSQSRGVGQQAPLIQGALAAQQVLPQISIVGQHCPFRQLCPAGQHTPLHTRLVGQHWPPRHCSLCVQQFWPHTEAAAQHSPLLKH